MKNTATISSNDEFASHTIKIDENYLYEYINSHLIAKIPIIHDGNKILIYQNDKLLSILIFDSNGNIKNSNNIVFTLQYNNYPKHNDIIEFSIGYDLCMRACKATHRLLGLDRELDSICCFWYPK